MSQRVAAQDAMLSQPPPEPLLPLQVSGSGGFDTKFRVHQDEKLRQLRRETERQTGSQADKMQVLPS